MHARNILGDEEFERFMKGSADEPCKTSDTSEKKCKMKNDDGDGGKDGNEGWF